MANIIDTTFKVNGSRNFTAIVQIEGDGSGDESTATVIDVAALTGVPDEFKVKSINWSLNDFSADLFWDADTPVLAAGLSQYSDDIDFFSAGAPLTNTAGTGKNGNLLLATHGLGASSRGTIVINGYH